MASTTHVITVRDNAASPPGTRMTALTPTWVFLKALSDNSNLTQPAISEVTQGAYKFSFDPETNGEAVGQIDAGASLTNPADRYIDVLLTRDSSRIATYLPGTGNGPRTVTVTVNDGSNVLQGAAVRLTEGANLYTATTNSSGVATFNVTDATYNVAITKHGYTFDQDPPVTLVVDGNETPTYSMTAQTIPAPAAPEQTNAYLTTRDGTGAAKAGVTLKFRLVNPDGTVDAYERVNFTATSDVNGLLQVALKKSSQYEAKLDRGEWIPFTTGSDSTFALPEVLGSFGS